MVPPITRRLLTAAALLLLLVTPAAASAASGTIRAFGAGGGRFTLTVDGARKARSVADGAVSARFSARTGRHTFVALSPSGRPLATARLRIAVGRRYVIALTLDARGRRTLVLIAEPVAAAGKAAYRIANLAAGAGSISLRLGDAPGLEVVHALAFGSVTPTLLVGGGASATGLFALRALSGATLRGSSTLVDATASQTTFALVRNGAAYTLTRLPWNAAPPVPVSEPAITGTRRVGNDVSCAGDSWTGAPTVTRHWTADGVDLPGATGTALSLLQAMHAGHTIGCRVTASRAGQVVTLRPTGFALTAPPVNVTPPTTSGRTAFGSVLTCDAGSWTGDTDPPNYGWLRDGSAITGEMASTYTLADPADRGKIIRCEETASNEGGTTAAVSGAGLLGGAPFNDALPTLSGTFQGGNTITLVAGTWDPVDAVLSYAWFRCIGASPCTQVAGDVPTYDLTDADSGATIHVTETATDAVDGTLTASADTAASDVVIPAAPDVAALAPDGISTSAATIHATITTHGLDSAIDVAYGEDTSYASTATPAPATVPGTSATGGVSAQLTGLTPSTVYHYHVVATSTSGATDGGDQQLQAAPAAIAGVTITGVQAVGEALTCDRGTWTGDADNTYTYRWLRDGAPIEGETTDTYVLGTADSVGGTTTVTCDVTASNDGFGGLPGGATTAAADVTVTLPAPPAVRLEGVTGTTGYNTTLIAEVNPNGGAGETYFEWGADTSYGTVTASTATTAGTTFEPATGASIPDALGFLTPSTEYHFRVVARNAGGTTTGDDHTFVTAPDVDPSPTATPPEMIPVDTTGVSVGDTVACAPGDWTVNGFPNTFAYTWWRTDFSSDPVQIAGETTTSYTLAPADAGQSVYCIVTATNIGGGSTSYATQTVDLPLPPTMIDPPQLSYTTLGVTDPIDAFPGTYDLVDTQTGVWVRCDAAGDNCVPTTETNSTYTILPGDTAASNPAGPVSFRYRETATNRGGSTTVDSDATTPIP